MLLWRLEINVAELLPAYYCYWINTYEFQAVNKVFTIIYSVTPLKQLNKVDDLFHNYNG